MLLVVLLVAAGKADLVQRGSAAAPSIVRYVCEREEADKAVRQEVVPSFCQLFFHSRDTTKVGEIETRAGTGKRVAQHMTEKYAQRS